VRGSALSLPLVSFADGRASPHVQSGSLTELVNNYAATNFEDWATYDDSSDLILVVVVGTALVDVGAASVFLGLARGHTAVVPTCLLAVTPSWGTLVAISVDAVLVSVTALPAVIVISIIVAIGVLVSAVLAIVSVISHQDWRAYSQRDNQAEYRQQVFGHVSSPLCRFNP
jgi:hypothetical protein